MTHAQGFRDAQAFDNLNLILALWARSLILQQLQQITASALIPIDALRSMRRLLNLARPNDDDIIFMCVALPLQIVIVTTPTFNFSTRLQAEIPFCLLQNA